MALSGSFTHYEYEDHPTETISSTFTYPADLPEGSEHYDLRGQTITTTTPVEVAVTSSYDGCYIFVKSTAVFTLNIEDGENATNINSIYRIYNSKAEKDVDIDSHIAEYQYDIDWDWDIDSNPNVKAYTFIKSLPGGGELSDI